MKRKKKLRRGIAAVMAFLMAFSSVDFTALAAPAYGGPDFGAIAEDFDYNRAKMLGGDRVYSLNHNTYKAFRSFRSVEFTEYTDAFGPYFEFSYPYNCEADIVVYRLDTLLTNTSIYEGGYPATKEMLKEENRLGIVKGILLENPSGLTQNQVEQRLRSMTGPGEELKEVEIFGSSGKNARYYTLEDYYRVNGILPEVMEDEEIENVETDAKENGMPEEEQPDMDLENSAEQPEKSDSDRDEGSVSDGDVVELYSDSARALQNEAGLTVSENTSVLPEPGEVSPAIQPEEETEEPSFTEQPEKEKDRFEEGTQSLEDEVLSDTVLPEDFYIMDTTSYAEEDGIALFSMEMPGNITHNYLRWDGTYIAEGGAEEKLPTTPGSYLLVIEPSESSKSLEKQVSILPFNVGIAGGSSGSTDKHRRNPDCL